MTSLLAKCFVIGSLCCMKNDANKIDPMSVAIALAIEAFDAGEVPVGAVITDKDGQIITSARNEMKAKKDATAHAEISVIQLAMARLGTARLENCDLWVTLEPCAMCAGAIAHARLRRLYYGAPDIKGGAVDNGPCLFHQPTIHHKPEIYGGMNEAESAKLLRDFFEARR